MRRLIPLALALATVVAVPASAGAAKLPKDVTRTTYRYPIDLRPGTNIIKIRFGVPKPQGPGYIVRFKPNLTRRDGSIPPTDKIHLHHAVWLRFGTGNGSTPGYPAEILTAVGEEKTIVTVPRPYGVPVSANETWLLNDMIHDLTNKGMRLYVAMVGYTDGDVVIDEDNHVVHIVYDTSADVTMQPYLMLTLHNFPNGTLDGTLMGTYHMNGDIKGDVTLNLTFAGQIMDGGGGLVVRVPGSTHITGTATNPDNGSFDVDVTL